MITKTAKNAKKQEVSKKPVPKQDIYDYAPAQHNPVKGEVALWTAVITQALMDAGSESRKPEAQHEKAKAIRWLLGNSEDFQTVCQNAGLDPNNIRQKAMKAIERGCVWRQGMAEKRQAKRKITPSTPLQKKFHTPYTRPQIISRFAPLSRRDKHTTPTISSGVTVLMQCAERF